MRPLAKVLTGAEAAAHDAATIAAAVPSRALMQRAGAAAATEIALRYPELLRRGAFVVAGPGNNGGDGWVIARALAATGVDVAVLAAEPRSPDCQAEHALASDVVRRSDAYTGEGVAIDALLGTGASGPVRDSLARARNEILVARSRGAPVIAVDLPSGLDATTGEDNAAIAADLTITFGSIKRGQLIMRGLCGEIVALDIGLLPFAGDAPELVDAAWVRERLPAIGADAHKGTRRKLVLHGGGPGMAGAAILGLRAALASGVGMAKGRVHPSSVSAIHAAVPSALVDEWPNASDGTPDRWADMLAIGPGLGRGSEARAAVIGALRRHRGPTLLDADALTVFANDRPAMREALAGRPALITPHPVECARLLGVDPKVVLDRRFDVGRELAREIGAAVLLKGVPTVVSAPDGRRLVVAAGTPVLATGGSGDLLTGIAATLLAQMADPVEAGACAALVHGRAAQLAGAFVRGTTLDQVLEMLPNAWRIADALPRYPVMAELPAVPTQ